MSHQTTPSPLLPRSMRCHVVELRPTEVQASYFTNCAGTMRFTYNSLVARLKSGEKYDRKAFQKHCSTLRKATPWMQKVSSRATYEAADNFNAAMKNFFTSCKGTRKGQKMSPPSFKKRGKSPSVVRFSHSSQFSIDGRNLKIQGLQEEIRMRENIRFKGQVKSLSIKLKAGKWFASFLVELAETLPAENTKVQEPRTESVGVDFGLTVLATLSTGEEIANPKPLRKKLRLLRRRQRQVSRKFVKGRKEQSHRYKIASLMVGRLHKKVADQRSASQHAFTSSLVKRFDRIVIEDLAVKNMMRNRKLSRAISDAGWATLRWQITYKAKASGCKLVIADRFFASSKTCFHCKTKLETLPLKTRVFVCPSCSYTANRDLNASRNLNTYEEDLSPPIMGRQKTCALDLGKSSSKDGAGLTDGANTKTKKLRTSTKLHSVG